MTKPTTLDEAIEQAGLGPASVTNSDGQSVTSKNVSEIIEAKNSQLGETAKTKDHLGIRLRQLKPGGMQD